MASHPRKNLTISNFQGSTILSTALFEMTAAQRWESNTKGNLRIPFGFSALGQFDNHHSMDVATGQGAGIPAPFCDSAIPSIRRRGRVLLQRVYTCSSKFPRWPARKPASPQGLFARQRIFGHNTNIGYATSFSRDIGSLSGRNSPLGSSLACSHR